MAEGLSAAGVAVPAGVVRFAAGSAMRLVWQNEQGGLTFEIAPTEAGEDRGRCLVKWVPTDSGIDLSQEVSRLVWAARYATVPRVLAQGRDAHGTWMATAALPGRNATTARWQRDPTRAVAAIGHGLRALHEALPVQQCPFSWSAQDRLAAARARVTAAAVDPHRWHEKHRDLDVSRALELLGEIPPVDKLVVCHGDPCAPNTLLTDDGCCSGHVDLGCLGVADRWADLAIATWSTQWNYGPGWEQLLLDSYGVSPDPFRTRYYRLLWDLDP